MSLSTISFNFYKTVWRTDMLNSSSSSTMTIRLFKYNTQPASSEKQMAHDWPQRTLQILKRPLYMSSTIRFHLSSQRNIWLNVFARSVIENNLPARLYTLPCTVVGGSLLSALGSQSSAYICNPSVYSHRITAERNLNRHPYFFFNEDYIQQAVNLLQPYCNTKETKDLEKRVNFHIIHKIVSILGPHI